jgi:ABC-2 type transport system permease protein
MRRILTLIKREYLSAVKTKGFVIGLFLAPVVFGGSGIAIALFSGQVDTTDKRIAIIDRSGAVAQALIDAAEQRNADQVHDAKTGSKVAPSYVLFQVEPDAGSPELQRLSLSDQVRAGTLHAFVEIGPSVLHPSEDSAGAVVSYHSKNPIADDIRRWLAEPLNDQLRWERLQDAGIEQSEVPDLFTWVSVEGLSLVSRDETSGQVKEPEKKDEIEAFVVPLIVAGFMILLMMMSAAPMLNAVMEEKTQRIAEVVLGLVTPFEFMMGKLVGALAVSLTGGVFYVAAAVVLLTTMGSFGYFPIHILPWFFAFLILGIMLFGSVFAALGSICNDAKDAQQLTFPAILPFLIPIFMLVPVLREPQSTLALVMSFIPPFTPLVMLLRMTSPEGVPGWQPWAALVLLVGSSILSIWFSGRVFRMGILSQGKLPQLRQLVQWAVKG